jgi:membrane associated rhomboid family serine protease
MTPWVRRLIIANVIVFIFTMAMPELTALLAFRPILILQRPWTVITYMFVHADFMHIFFNMLVLYFFGPRLESRLGERRFIILYFIAGITGALLSFAPMYRYSWIVGASGAVFGVEFGFARFWPRERIYIWGLLPVEAWLLVVIMTGLSLWGGMTGGGNVAHFAHLGGFLGAFLYLKFLDLRSPARKFKQAASQPARRSASDDGADLRRWQRIDREAMHPVNREELDRVFDKIKTAGVTSLTPDERAFLDRFTPGQGEP